MQSPVTLMVAPTGARRTRSDHPHLPITDDEIVEAVADAHAAGAQAAHVHLRDADGAHLLDADRYVQITETLKARCGEDLIVQITTETADRYTAADQRALVEAVRPEAVSIALVELFANPDDNQTNADFLAAIRDAGTAVQWILYSVEDVARLGALMSDGLIPRGDPMLFVLGRYAIDHESQPGDLWPFLAARAAHSATRNMPFSVCAFGRGETACLTAGLLHDGSVRIGFENSLWHPDGSLATSNAERVAYLVSIMNKLGMQLATPDQARRSLGIAQST